VATLTDTYRTWLLNQLGITAAAAASMTVSQLETALYSSTGNAPSYAGQRANPFYRQHNVYNFKQSNTRKTRLSLAKAMTGGFAEWAWIGTSVSAGSSTGVGAYSVQKSIDRYVKEELARHGVPLSTGMVRELNNDGPIWDLRWAYTGAWTSSNVVARYTTANGATATFTTDVAGDRTTIYYYDFNDGGTFTYSIAGGAPVTVTQNTGAGRKKITVNGAIAAGQTVVFTKVSGGFMEIFGVNVWSSTGCLMLHNIAQSGSNVTGTDLHTAWALNSANTNALWEAFKPSNLATVNAFLDTLFIEHGINDMLLGTYNEAATITGIQTILGHYPAAEPILILAPQVNPATIPAATQDSFSKALYDLADTLDCPLVDIRSREGDYATATANGVTLDGFVHQVSAANADVGRSLGQLLAS
jgi:hypothetical protein